MNRLQSPESSAGHRLNGSLNSLGDLREVVYTKSCVIKRLKIPKSLPRQPEKQELPTATVTTPQ